MNGARCRAGKPRSVYSHSRVVCRSSVFFVSRRIHTWPHEAPEAARPLRCPRDRMLVRCCTPSTRHALSAAAVWPPAGLPGAPLLQHASQPSAGQLQAAAQHQPVRRATPRWEFSKVLQLRARLDRIYIIDLVEAPLSVCVLPHLRLPKVVETTGAGDDPRRIRERTAS